ncbi:DUF461 domain-containing protein [Streptomyces tsukubensis]|uniref:DUF461 domain-containing protein n=2 Tax=Streptomyces TaxID=1883 RepID=A0A1V4A907_9ACTN|nr:DUF461 domain-containing protein [Streptomyces tsukubensis]OON78805.1 DUF461 domain-containing protein [Streptomyces tsukubensis]QFR94282.1 DUF461 domain-containing protein [Streptomyces tsukubensis]CAY26035.1 putative lipoprotein [Streptomyces tacrolimicus]
MSSSLRRGALAATALAFSIGSLAACGAGNNAQTLEVKPDNAATSIGDIKVQNSTVITQPDLKSTGPAVVSATIFNSGRKAQTLDAISVNGTGKTATLKPAKGSGPISVPAGGRVVIGGDGNASATLDSSRTAVKDGNAQLLTFSFSRTGDVRLKSLVVPAEHYFKKWGPTEAPSPSAGDSGTPGDKGTGSPSASDSGSPKAGSTASGDASDGNADGAGSSTASSSATSGTNGAAAG